MLSSGYIFVEWLLQKVRFIGCVDGLPVCKMPRLMAGKFEGFAIDSKKVILVDSPHQGVEAIETTDQAIVPFQCAGEIQDINKADDTFPGLEDGLAFTALKHVVTLAFFGVFSGRSLSMRSAEPWLSVPLSG
mgnify:FL=1